MYPEALIKERYTLITNIIKDRILKKYIEYLIYPRIVIALFLDNPV